jgi:hypothetical protein
MMKMSLTTEAAIMALPNDRERRLELVLESNEILEEFTEKSILKQVVLKKVALFYEINSFTCTYHSDILNVFQCNKMLL